MRLHFACAVTLLTAAGAGCGSDESSGSGGAAACGDGTVGGGEDCDDGNDTDDDGCTASCRFSCSGETECDDDNDCTADTCSDAHTCTHAADPAAEGNTCTLGGESGRCSAGACVVLGCGDGEVDPGEQCDAGAQNGRGTGCELDCTLSCEAAADCDDGKACNGLEDCAPVANGQACMAGEPAAEDSLCETGYCKAGACVAAVCGNDRVEPTETCEPPGAGNCNAACQTVVCGDGVLVTPDEECDDGDLENLDGCDASCRYELVMRWDKAEIVKGPPPSFCAHAGNALGDALSQFVIDQFNINLANGVDLGATNDFFYLSGLDDPSGESDGDFAVGLLSGTLDPSHPGTFTAGALDWWFLAAASDITPSGLPKFLMSPASATDHVFVAGPSDVDFHVTIGTYLNHFQMRDMMVRGTFDVPQGSSPPAPPPDQLDPSLSTFESLRADGPDEGFCGAVTVASLSVIPLPEQFTAGGSVCTSACSNSKSYVYCGQGQPVGPSCNSMLDLLVGGCRVGALCVIGSTPTQPDVGTDGNAPALLVGDPMLNKVDPPVPTDAYSTSFVITARRAHITNNLQ